MSEHVYQARRETGAAPSVQSASAKPTTVPADIPADVAGLDALHAALNDTPKVKLAMQLRRSLSRTPRAVQLAHVARMAQRAPAAGQIVQRLELTDKMWTHIARGEFRESSKKLVGYHWTGDGTAIAQKSGESKKGPDGIGVYVEGVQTIKSYGQGKKAAPVTKATPSTFWPDAWSEAEIKDAIANGGKASNNISEVGTKATKSDARGMKLFVNPESVFPVFEETTESEGQGGKNKRSTRRR
jgi:hypothetical protein